MVGTGIVQFLLMKAIKSHHVLENLDYLCLNPIMELAPLVIFFLPGTADMYFTSMAAEAALDTAGRQNAHSMTLSVRMLSSSSGLSIVSSCIGRSWRFRYHMIIGLPGSTAFIFILRLEIKQLLSPCFDVTELDGRDRLAFYQFVLGIYDGWAPFYFKRRCSAITRWASERYGL